MASGKTTFGRALAKRLEWRFIDLDEEVGRIAGMTPAEIISEQGEEAFRLLESRALKATAGMSHVVVACGGGTPCWRDNMEFMTLHGQTLWLVASPERMAERIRIAGATRPLVAGKTEAELVPFITGHLRRRQPYYCRAFWRLSGEHLETEAEIQAAVDTFVQTFKPILPK